MTDADVVDLAQTLCYDLGDATEMTRIFSELMIELGQDPRAWFTNVAVFDGGTIADPTDTAHLEFPLSLNVVHLLALFFDGRQLTQESLQHLDAVDPLWRDKIDTPISFVTEGESDRQMRLYPKARTQIVGGTMTTVQGSPAAIYTEARTSLIPKYFDLPLAWLVLGREFERESPHRDVNFAAIATALGKAYLEYLA